MHPRFSIALTTYDRVDLLRETLNSVLNQTFTDFELLVGNDNINRDISKVFVDIDDTRIRWINNSHNLGSIANTNNVLSLARGDFVTTLADDDLFAPEYLEHFNELISENPDVSAFFCRYVDGTTPSSEFGEKEGNVRVMSGSEWLRGYIAKDFKAIGCYGMLTPDVWRSFGGIRTLGSKPAFSPYNDNLTAVQCGSCNKVVFSSRPLVFFRLHPESLSFSSIDVDAYSSAQREFMDVAEGVMLNDRQHFQENSNKLLKWFLFDYLSVLARSHNIPLARVLGHCWHLLSKADFDTQRSVLPHTAKHILAYLSPGLVARFQSLKKRLAGVFRKS